MPSSLETVSFVEGWYSK